MARKPRKKKVQEIRKLWEIPLEEIEAYAAHLREKFPTSGHLPTYENEIQRRAVGGPIPEIPNE